MKRKRLVPTIVIMAVIAVIAVLASGVVLKSKKLRHYQKQYESFEKGMPKEKVVRQLGTPHKQDGPPTDYWDSVKLDQDQITKIVESVSYHVTTPYISIVYRFSFDQDGRLIGKHCYD